MLLPGLIMLAAAMLLTGCEEAGAGGGNDDAGGSDSPDISGQILHLGLDGDLTDETGNVSTVGSFDGSGGTPSVVYGEDRDGNANGAAEFNTDYHLGGTGLDLSSLNSITVMAWIRDEGNSGPPFNATQDHRIVAYHASGGVEFAARLRGNDLKFEAFIEDSGSNGTRTDEPVVPGLWVHVALVYHGDTDELVLYQDGERKASQTLSPPLDIESGDLIIGGKQNNEEFDGQIDDLVVFNRALSDTDVAHARTAISTTD